MLPVGRLLALLATVPLSVPALTTSPPTPVRDADVLRVLEAEYHEPVRLTGEWTTRQAFGPAADPADAGRGGSRVVCADSRPATGPRLVAVCTALDDAGHVDSGVVDLFKILDARDGESAPRIGARERGIDSGSYGSPGAVRLLAIGGGRTAFAIDSSYTNMGSSTTQTSLHLAQEGGAGFDMLLSVATALGTGADCDPSIDGAACRARQVDLDCTLQRDPAADDGGFSDLLLQVDGMRAGKPVHRRLRIPHTSRGYEVSREALARDACDGGF